MDLDALHKKFDDLDVEDPRFERVAKQLVELEPDNEAAWLGLGRHYLGTERAEEALATFEAGSAAVPESRNLRERAAEERRAAARPAPKTVPAAVKKPRVLREPAAILDGVPFGEHRAPCLGFVAWSIARIETIDSGRLAVTDYPSEKRFRVLGGIYSAVTPHRKRLCLSVDRELGADVITRVVEAGGKVVDEPGPGSATPKAVQLGVPFAMVADVADALREPHEAHLRDAIAAGAPTTAWMHHEALRRAIVEEGG